MREGNLLHFDRFQTKKNYYNYARGQFTTFWQIPDKKITIMREGILLPIDRFQTNIIIIIMREGKLVPIDRFRNKKLQLCERPIYYLLTGSRQKTNFNWERAIYYLLTDSRQKNSNYARGQITTYWQIPDKNNNYNYVRGQFTTIWQIPDKKNITIMREGNLLPFDRFQK